MSTPKVKNSRAKTAKNDEKYTSVYSDIAATKVTFTVPLRQRDHLRCCFMCDDSPKMKIKTKKEKVENDNANEEFTNEDVVEHMKSNVEKRRGRKKNTVKEEDMSVIMKKEIKKETVKEEYEGSKSAYNAGYIKCAFPRCSQRMHPDCAANYIYSEYTPEQAQLLFGTKGPVCLAHFCFHCYDERHKNAARFGELVDCEKCMRSYHLQCIPAGTKITSSPQKGRKTFVCHHHAPPRNIPILARLKYCIECEKIVKVTSGNKEERMECKTCTNVFHRECAYKIVKGHGSENYKQDQCAYCLVGANIVSGQHVLAFLGIKFRGLPVGTYPGVAVSLAELPPNVMKSFGDKAGKTGWIPIKWKWNGFDIPYYNIIHMSQVQRMMIECEMNVTARDFREELRESEHLFIPPTYPLDHNAMMRTIQLINKNVYMKGIKRHVIIQDTMTCFCKPDPITKIKCADDSCHNRMMHAECTKECEEEVGVKCANRSMQLPEEKETKKYKVEIAPNGKGMGVFATREIKQREFIFEYAGEVIDKEEHSRREKRVQNLRANDEWTYMMGLGGKRNLIVDARFMGSEARYANHSCSPNCEVQSVDVPVKTMKNEKTSYELKLKVHALKNIKAGQEITFSYGMVKSRGLALDKCHCGEENCIGKIGEKKDKTDSDDERYEQYERFDEETTEDEDSVKETKKEIESKNMQKKRGRPKKVVKETALKKRKTIIVKEEGMKKMVKTIKKKKTSIGNDDQRNTITEKKLRAKTPAKKELIMIYLKKGERSKTHINNSKETSIKNDQSIKISPKQQNSSVEKKMETHVMKKRSASCTILSSNVENVPAKRSK